MEVFFDFGLFELLAVLGISALARVIYARRWLAIGFVAASVVIPAVLVFLSQGETRRWLAAGCFSTAIVNAAVVLGAMQRGDVPILKIPLRARH